MRADTDKAVAGLYGTLGPLGFARRSVFIVDGGGMIRYAHRAIAGLTFRPVSELVEQVYGAVARGDLYVLPNFTDAASQAVAQGIAMGRATATNPYPPMIAAVLGQVSEDGAGQSATPAASLVRLTAHGRRGP